MCDGVTLTEPPSVTESDYIAYPDQDTDTVVLDKLGSATYSKKNHVTTPTTDSTFLRNFRLSSLSSISSWVTSINAYVDKRREDMMANVHVSNISEDYLDYGSGADALSVTSAVQRANDIHTTEKKVLGPYIFHLKLLGMRSIGSPDNLSHQILSWLWTVIIFVIIIMGYVLNFKFCKDERGDLDNHGEGLIPICRNKTITYNYMEGYCRSSLESFVPSIIHFIAFSYTFLIFKIKQSEQVEALVQKTLVSGQMNTSPEMRRDTFIRRLKINYMISYVCLILLFVLTVINSYCGKALIWFECSPVDEDPPLWPWNMSKWQEHYLLGMLVCVPSFFIYWFLTPILLNFNIQAKLIQHMIMELRETLREKRSSLKALMQEGHDISTFVHKMNTESSPAMSFIVLYLSYAIFVDLYSIVETINEAGSVTKVFSKEDCHSVKPQDICERVKTFGSVSIVVVFLRDIVLCLMLFVTLYQGCKIATLYKQLVNQSLETRVFGHTNQDENQDIDSFHYYMRSLRIRAKLFQYPLETKRLLFPFVLLLFLVLCLDIHYQFL